MAGARDAVGILLFEPIGMGNGQTSENTGEIGQPTGLP